MFLSMVSICSEQFSLTSYVFSTKNNLVQGSVKKNAELIKSNFTSFNGQNKFFMRHHYWKLHIENKD